MTSEVVDFLFDVKLVIQINLITTIFADYKLFINCGGESLKIDDKEYADDSIQIGRSTFYSTDRWAYSSTGDFLGNDNANYVAKNTSVLTMPNQSLYTSARLSPLSLKYYGLCLQNGNYSVQLHFAEIMFTDDQTFLSVGKRIFDVSIQVIDHFLPRTSTFVSPCLPLIFFN